MEEQSVAVDGQQCQQPCGTQQQEDSKGGAQARAGGQGLCESCHDSLHGQHPPRAQPPASTHTGPFFSKPCRWAAQEARADRMYRKTLIWAVERDMSRPESRDSFCLAQRAQEPQLFLKGIHRTLSSCLPQITF